MLVGKADSPRGHVPPIPMAALEPGHPAVCREAQEGALHMSCPLQRGFWSSSHQGKPLPPLPRPGLSVISATMAPQKETRL